MTRARDRLYVVGIAKQSLNNDTRWHPLVAQGLNDELVERQSTDNEIELEWRAAPAMAKQEIAAATEAASTIVLPAWATRAAPPAPRARVRITPSSGLVGTPANLQSFVKPSDPANKLALERGRLIHRLLQSLPDIAPDRRAEIGARYLAAFAKTWSEDDRDKLLAEVLAVLNHPDFAEAFGENSRAEVEIAGRLGDATVAGRIDRLAVTPIACSSSTTRPTARHPKNSPTFPPRTLRSSPFIARSSSACTRTIESP